MPAPGLAEDTLALPAAGPVGSGSQKKIARPSRLQLHNVNNISYPNDNSEKAQNDESIKDELQETPVVNAKVDVEYVKFEQVDNEADTFDNDINFDDYYEPEPFVNNIDSEIANEVTGEENNVDTKKKSKHKESKKKLKEKKVKNKLKIKKDTVVKKTKQKKQKTDVPLDLDLDPHSDPGASSDGLTDLESVIDFYSDAPNVSKPIKTPKEKVKSQKGKLDKPLYDPTEIKLITLTHDEMLKEREKEALADYFVKCPHRCEDCILGFKYERTLQTHIETKHSESAGPHECPVCRVRFEDMTTFSDHSRRHLQRYKCTVCGKKTLALVAMLKHAKNHKEYKCDVCGEVSGSLFRHQTHLTKAHREKPQCVECGKMFSSRKTYRYHMNVIHKGQNRFPCPHCGKVYQWKSNLWRHIKNHKARDNGELFCAPCNKKFSSIATYQQHLKISRKHVTENEFNYMCSECGKKFANKTRLRDHVDWEHLKKINYRCQQCNKPFKSNTSLYVHMQNVHKNKEEKDNLCHVCGKSYQNIAKLKYHIVAMHTTETPYSCEQCPSSFSWYSSLYRHVKEVHEKVKLKKKRKPKQVPVL